jgi:hypothetical protein
MEMSTQQIEAQRAHALVADRLLSLPGVHGVAVGFKQTGGTATSEPSVVVFVDKKTPVDELAPEHVIPRVVPGTNVKTDVVEYPRVVAQMVSDKVAGSAPVGSVIALADTGRYDPLVGGVQIQSHANNAFVGTLGTALYDTKNRRAVGLSNWHVLYPWAPPGGAGDGVFQPLEGSGDQIGTTILGKADGSVDAAIFDLSGRAYTFQIQDIGSWSGKLDSVALGTAVMKRGRTTGLTQGTVQYVNGTIMVDYGGGHSITYNGQIGVVPTPPSTKFSDHGDSGSVVLDTAGKHLVSLNFAGNGTDGWGGPIAAVEAALDFVVTPDTTDTGVFNTMDVRPWNMPQLQNSKSVVFSPPYATAPTIAMGLTELDVANSANLRIAASSSGVAGTGFTASLNAWADTVLYSAGCTWLEVPPGDPDFQIGQFNTQDDHPWNQPKQQTSRRISFAPPYAGGVPNVVVWLNELDMANSANARVTAYVTDVDTQGFTVHIDTWADSTLYSGGITWIAYPADKSGVISGTFNTQDVRPWNQPRADTSATIAFPGGGFTAPPRVLVALNTLDVDHGANLRIVASASDITAGGMTWHLDSWADTTLYSAGAAYIAIS